MITEKSRILAAARGETADRWPYVPRIDLWFNAHSRAGTLPREHAGRDIGAICEAEGWGAHRLVPAFLRQGQQAHRALGLYNLVEQPFTIRFSPDLGVTAVEDGDFITTTYETPVGVVRTKTMYSEDMRASGASITWVAEHVLKTPADYEAVAWIFENLILTPNYDAFARWLNNEVGDGGIGAAFASLAASPMHHIQKDFLDATDFYYHYRDNATPMARLAEALGFFYDQAFKLVLDSPAEAVLWGANFDDMITYPAYFQKEIQPWLRKVGPAFRERGKVCICHCDGENFGLMELLPDSGFQVAEAICPWPMTKVRLGEYYSRWRDRLTIFGGVPSNILLDELATDEDFEGYLDAMFRELAPGDRFIVGIADTTPPQANWDRLRRLGERVAREGRLPLAAGAAVLVDTARRPEAPSSAAATAAPPAGVYADLLQMVLDGDDERISAEVERLLLDGRPAREIMGRGLVAAMDIISPDFKAGRIFIPEVLMAARAMNQAMETLEPHLKSRDSIDEQKTIVLGTVFGDLHDIGKNMVATMLKGAGFKVIDLGINVPARDFIAALKEHCPDILGLSALLTTTMPEMARTVASVTESGLKGRLKIMVGGAPVNEKFARDIGADGYSADAGEAVELARRLAGCQGVLAIG